MMRTLNLSMLVAAVLCHVAHAQSVSPAAACKPPPGAFGSVQKMDVSMEGKIFLLPQKPDNQWVITLKDFDSLPSTGSVFTDKWDIPSRAFTEGFPGVTNRFE